MTDTKLRSRFLDLQARYFDRIDKWANAVGRQDLNEARRHKASAYRLLRKAYAVEGKAHDRAECWTGAYYGVAGTGSPRPPRAT